MTTSELKSKAKEIRVSIVKTIFNAKGGHVGTSLSETDILTVLYFRILNTNPEDFQNPNRDRFVLSKGHGSEGLYCTLAARGFFPQSDLNLYLRHESKLTIHPTSDVHGVEINTGALGHGFSIGVGMALAAKRSNKIYRTFVVVGDGEIQEGSNWEAAMAAAHFKLGNFTLIIDNNTLQLADKIENTMRIEPLDKKLEAFGFDTHHVDGHSIEDLVNLFESLDYNSNKPHAIIAHTIKGKGVSFMENVAEWHHKVPTAEEAELALKELSQ